MLPYYILVVLSVLLFFYGFFPVNKTTGVFNIDPPTHINNISLNTGEIYSADVDKIVLVIIDALRLDFANSKLMPLTSSMTELSGCFNELSVETPTVTMPRIKALTAGNVPQFIDLVLNLMGTEILEDSLVHSMSKKQKRIVFYGDNTWLKLFPKSFARSEGTNSFFVRDFKEVDDNVTRNVDAELVRDDWDMMILHYLGLDHIGHVYGPFSSLIPGKLKEMDEIIYKIYSKMAIRNQKTLLIVTGDHGMRDSGGHGGSTFHETHVPLLAIGLPCSRGSFQQTDIPINLAVLLGLTIPSTSIGQLRSNFLPFSIEKFLFVFRYNALHLLEKSTLGEEQFLLATKFHELYLRGGGEENAFKAIELYEDCSELISEYLLQSSVKQNMQSLIVALLIMGNVLVVFVRQLVSVEKINALEYFTYLVIVLLQFSLGSDTISFMSMFVLGMILVINLARLKTQFKPSGSVTTVLVLFTVIHPLTFVSSSFIEEEHQFWYFCNNLFLLINVLYFVRNYVKSILYWLLLLVALRFLRTMNSVGDKWANYPDVSDWLLKTDNYAYLQVFFIFGLVEVFFVVYLLTQSKDLKFNILNAAVLLCIFIFKSEENNIFLAKLIWFLILSHTIFFYKYPKLVIWILISTLLLKPYNVILLSYCVFACVLYSSKYTNTTIITLSYTWLGNMLFFAQGHSNSVATVDMSVGYIGLTEYQPLLVMPQALCHIFAFPVLCHFLILRNKNTNADRVWTILFCNQLYIVLVTSIITLVFRHHLFIWSVFAPKLFIETVRTVFLFIEFGLYYCYEQFMDLCRFIKKRL